MIDSLLTGVGATYTSDDFRAHLEGKSEHLVRNIAALRRECLDRGIIFIVAKQQARSMTIQDVSGLTYSEEVEAIRARFQ